MVAFVVCYFGRFPNYFQLWLNSCSNNDEYKWLLFTDNKEKYNYPKNVIVIYITLSEVKKLIYLKTEIKPTFSSPYKLCDFKPLYGKIFEDYLKDYSHWGFCDIDLIWGNLNNFIGKELLNRYDMLFENGHMLILKNSEEMNNLYKKPYSGISMNKILSSRYHFGFDEYKGLSMISNENDVYKYVSHCFADINCRYYHFQLADNSEKKIRGFRINSDGIYSIDDNVEYMYVHLQKRKMNILFNAHDIISNYYIFPNFFSLDRNNQHDSFIKQIKYYLDKEAKVISEKIRWNFHWKIKWVLRLYRRK